MVRCAARTLTTMSADVIILAGPPGAGKSTTARALAHDFPRSVHLHTDDFWHFIASGAIPPYLPESEAQNHTVMEVIVHAAAIYARGDYTVIVDGIVGPWMLDHFRVLTRHPDPLPVHYLVLRPSREVALDRATARTGPDDLTDEEPITTMWDQFSHLGELEDHVIDSSIQTSAQTLAAARHAVETATFRLR